MTAIIKLLWRPFVLSSRVLFFVFFFLMALINSQTVEFHWFVGQSTQVPLIVIILGAFLLGILLAGLAFYRNAKKGAK